MSNKKEETEESPQEIEVSSDDHPEPEPLKTDEVVEVSWEHAEDLFQLRTALKGSEKQLSWYLLECEKNKATLLSRINELESAIYVRANSLRESYNISPEITYELKLPQNEGEKSYFIRKEDQ